MPWWSATRRRTARSPAKPRCDRSAPSATMPRMRYVALLRAVNVGGTGKLAMIELRALCEAIGFDAPRTYIQSGNVLFESALPEAKVKATLEKALAKKMGKAPTAIVRTAKELEATLKHNPF